MMKRTATIALALILAVGGCGRQGEADGNQAAAGNAAAERSDRTIGEGLAASGDHRRFMEAVEAAGLGETLRGPTLYTVFAPSDAAFEAVPEDARTALMAPEQRQRLAGLLSYHMVPGTVTVEDLAAAAQRGEGGRAELATVGGANLLIGREGDAVTVSDGSGATARIVRGDAVHSNGVVHTIDAVLMPQAD